MFDGFNFLIGNATHDVENQIRGFKHQIWSSKYLLMSSTIGRVIFNALCIRAITRKARAKFVSLSFHVDDGLRSWVCVRDKNEDLGKALGIKG